MAYSDIFGLIQSAGTILISYTLFFLLYYIIKYVKNSNLEKAKRYTLDFCSNDKINYSILISANKNDLGFSNRLDEGLFDILNNFEKIAIGIKNKVLDEDIIKDFYGRYFLLCYKLSKYHVLLEYRNKNNEPFVFIEFEKLANKWSNNKNWRE